MAFTLILIIEYGINRRAWC